MTEIVRSAGKILVVDDLAANVDLLRSLLTPVVLITALQEREDKLQGINAGADDFLIKPVNAHEPCSREQPDRTDTVPWAAPFDGIKVQSTAAHLVDHGARYPAGGARASFRWRGPYMERLSPDPWGSRYASNVGALVSKQGFTTIVLSAGPNRIVDTPFQMIGLRTGGDDVIGLVGSGR